MVANLLNGDRIGAGSIPKKQTPRWQAGRLGYNNSQLKEETTSRNPNKKTAQIWAAEAFEAVCLGRRWSIA